MSESDDSEVKIEKAESLINTIPREVWCPRCNFDSINDKPFPKCLYCGSNLITIVYSPLTDMRLTGEFRKCLIGSKK